MLADLWGVNRTKAGYKALRQIRKGEKKKTPLFETLEESSSCRYAAKLFIPQGGVNRKDFEGILDGRKAENPPPRADMQRNFRQVRVSGKCYSSRCATKLSMVEVLSCLGANILSYRQTYPLTSFKDSFMLRRKVRPADMQRNCLYEGVRGRHVFFGTQEGSGAVSLPPSFRCATKVERDNIVEPRKRVLPADEQRKCLLLVKEGSNSRAKAVTWDRCATKARTA